MSDLHLTDKTLLVTGPVGQADAWAREAEEAGWTATVYPLVQVRELEVEIAELIDGLPDWICLTSRNALPALETAANLVPELRSVAFACVGEGTREAASKAGFKPALPAASSAAELASALCEQADSGGYVLWPRGSLSELLAERLREAGRQVLDPVVYETTPLEQTAPPAATRVVFFASPSAVKAWEALGVRSVPDALAIGSTTRAAIEDASSSFHTIHSLDAPLQSALKDWLSRAPLSTETS